MLSRTAEYALRAVLLLARNGREAHVPVDDIAKHLSVPRNYLSKILHALARVRLLESTRGPHGGFRLAVPPEQLTIADVIGPFEELDRRAGCLLGRGQCSDATACSAHHHWKDVSERINAFFNNTTIAQLAGSDNRIALD